MKEGERDKYCTGKEKMEELSESPVVIKESGMKGKRQQRA